MTARTSLVRHSHGSLEGAARPRVLLVCMPFTCNSGPSPALSQLKPLLVREGIACDVYYGDLAFRTFCDDDEAYNCVASKWLVGEWVFGPALFDDLFIHSKRRDVGVLCEVLPAAERAAVSQALERLTAKSKPFLDHVLETVGWSRYDVVGFSSMFAQNTASLALARAVKRRWPHILIAFGGANVLGLHGRRVMRLFEFVDWVVNGEGEIAFPEAVRRWSTGESVHGIAGLNYRLPEGGIVEQGMAAPADLDDLPHPDFGDFLCELRARAPELEAEMELPIEMSRGCWWGDRSKCIFCALNASVGCYRYKSPQRILEEAEDLVDRYGIRRLRFVDNNIPRQFFHEVCPALASRLKLDSLFVETMASITRENLSLLARAGTRVFQPGIESLDSAHLRLMRKGTTMLHNIQLLKWSRELNLRISWNLLHGFPEEEPESFQRMAELVPRLAHLEPPSHVMNVILQPFSPLFEEARRFGVHNPRPHRAYRTIYPYDEAELLELAYAYEFDRIENDQLCESTARAIAKFEEWKKTWDDGRPPLLGFLDCEGGRVKIFDTRSIRSAAVVKLEGHSAAAYIACGQRRSAYAVTRFLRESLNCPDLSLERTIAVLDDLVDRRLMVKEATNYLSLACDLRRMARHGASPRASMLVSLEALAATADE